MISINNLYCIDAIEGMKLLPENSIDFCITSPPYNIDIEYDIYDDKLQWPDYYAWCFDWITELYRVLKPDGRFLLNHYFSMGQSGWRETPLMVLNQLALDVGFSHHAVIFWDDVTRSRLTAWGSWMSASSPYISSPFEGLLCLYKEQWKKNRKGVSTIEKEEFMTGVSGVWRIGQDRKPEHPTSFPKKLVERAINLFTYEEDVVLDPFIGAGTTSLVAKELNRNYIGFDISENYIKIAKEKLNDSTN
jgi:site-specific DNA-methyltransferase (adenine-specific)